MQADFSHFKKIPISIRYLECAYIHVPTYKSNLSVVRILSHLSFGKQVGKIIEQLNPELLYCQVPPNNLVKKCKRYTERHPETKLILDIIDL